MTGEPPLIIVPCSVRLTPAGDAWECFSCHQPVVDLPVTFRPSGRESTYAHGLKIRHRSRCPQVLAASYGGEVMDVPEPNYGPHYHHSGQRALAKGDGNGSALD